MELLCCLWFQKDFRHRTLLTATHIPVLKVCNTSVRMFSNTFHQVSVSLFFFVWCKLFSRLLLLQRCCVVLAERIKGARGAFVTTATDHTYFDFFQSEICLEPSTTGHRHSSFVSVCVATESGKATTKTYEIMQKYILIHRQWCVNWQRHLACKWACFRMTVVMLLISHVRNRRFWHGFCGVIFHPAANMTWTEPYPIFIFLGCRRTVLDWTCPWDCWPRNKLFTWLFYSWNRPSVQYAVDSDRTAAAISIWFLYSAHNWLSVFAVSKCQSVKLSFLRAHWSSHRDLKDKWPTSGWRGHPVSCLLGHPDREILFGQTKSETVRLQLVNRDCQLPLFGKRNKCLDAIVGESRDSWNN